jgi:diguanylate cyclase (GGDEF)-like protein
MATFFRTCSQPITHFLHSPTPLAAFAGDTILAATWRANGYHHAMITIAPAPSPAEAALEEIERGIRVGRMAEVRAAGLRWLELHQGTSGPAALARATECVAIAAEQLGMFADAIQLNSSALKHYRELADPHGESRAHYAIATVYRRIGQSNLSFERVALLTRLADQDDDPLIRFYAVRAHAASLDVNGKNEEALVEMRRAFELAERAGHAHAHALAYTGMVSALTNRLEALINDTHEQQAADALIEEIRDIADRGFAHCEAAGYPILQCVCLNNLATALNFARHFDESATVTARQLALAETIQSRPQRGWALANMGERAMALGDCANAKTTLNEALQIAREIGEVQLITTLLASLVNIHRKELQWEQALEYFEEFHTYKVRSTRSFADAQAKILQLEIDNAHAREEAATHEARAAELAMEAMRLADKAEQDALTGLANRHGFERLVGGAMARLKANNGTLAMAMIDLDNLKPINDSLSHLAGDKVLRAVAATIKKHCRKTDIAVRLGGDEFAIVFDGLTAVEAERVCRRVQETLREQPAIEQVALHPTVSIGIAETSLAIPIDTLIARADEALYRAKANGKNRIEIAV